MNKAAVRHLQRLTEQDTAQQKEQDQSLCFLESQHFSLQHLSSVLLVGESLLLLVQAEIHCRCFTKWRTEGRFDSFCLSLFSYCIIKEVDHQNCETTISFHWSVCTITIISTCTEALLHLKLRFYIYHQQSPVWTECFWAHLSHFLTIDVWVTDESRETKWAGKPGEAGDGGLSATCLKSRRTKWSAAKYLQSVFRSQH